MLTNKLKNMDYENSPWKHFKLIMCTYKSASDKKPIHRKTKKEFNDFLEETMEDGTHEQMIDTWFSLDSKTKNIDLKSLKDINGTIKVALIEGTAPFTFLANNQYSGLMVDLVARFAKRYQYGVKFEGYSGLGAVISAVNSGLADIGAAPITITKEREQAVLFSNCFYEDKMGILLRKEDKVVFTTPSSE